MSRLIALTAALLLATPTFAEEEAGQTVIQDSEMANMSSNGIIVPLLLLVLVAAAASSDSSSSYEE